MTELLYAFLAYLGTLIFVIGFSLAAVRILGAPSECSTEVWLLYGQGRER